MSNAIPGYDAWKLSAPEGPYPCDHCQEVFSEDDLDVLDSGQFCRDCTPCESCGENVGEAQLDDFAELCKSCVEDREQDAYDAEQAEGGLLMYNPAHREHIEESERIIELCARQIEAVDYSIAEAECNLAELKRDRQKAVRSKTEAEAILSEFRDLAVKS